MYKFLRPLRAWLRPRFRVVCVEGDVPTSPKIKTLYVVIEDNIRWSAAMLCPCGCGALINLNLLSDERPTWQLIKHQNNNVSLAPSIWRTVECRAHFWFRENRVYWTIDQPNQLLRDLRLLLRIR